MSNEPNLFESRYPYASEAKGIVALSLGLDEETMSHFKKHWEVKMQPNGRYAISRDVFMSPTELKDDWIRRGLEEKYAATIVKKGDKFEANVELPMIEAPSGQNLKGANGKPCCHGRACPACPQNRA